METKNVKHNTALYLMIGTYVVGLILFIVIAITSNGDPTVTNNGDFNFIFLISYFLMGIAPLKPAYMWFMRKNYKQGFIYTKGKLNKYFIEQRGFHITGLQKYGAILLIVFGFGIIATPILIIKTITKKEKTVE